MASWSETVPFPPSLNAYWRRKGHVYFIDRRGVRFRAAVAAAVGLDPPRMTGRLRVLLALSAPTRRRYDVDNFAKPVLDALEHAGVFLNDSQVDHLVIRRREPSPGGACHIKIEEISS